ncbi:MAG: S-layer homology domain-containing protein [Clostridia bacterium]|nr:S-layer homology domain-containing protein [Clostridia bacterium]
MKKILSILILSLAMVTALSLCVSAKKENWAKDNEFLLTSFHTLYKHVDGNGFEEAIYTILENAEEYNIKYVSLLGKLTNLSKHVYKDVITNGGKTIDDLILLHQNDKEWNAEWNAIQSMTELLTESAIPYGLGYDIVEYYGNGSARGRDSSISTYFAPADIFHEDIIYSKYDDSNYYTIIKNNNIKYIVFQLETCPRQSVLDWFNETLSNHTDKYAIVYTPSFLDTTGEMYTMWDWNEGGIKLVGNSRLKGYTIANVDKPRDGEALWQYAFSKHNNILAIISSNITPVNSILTKKLTNEAGYNTAAIMASSAGIDQAEGPYMLMTKVSEDNKTLSFKYYSPVSGYIDSTEVVVKLDNIATLTEPTTVDGLPTIALQQNGANKSYILGYAGNTFRPNANMTRAEACTIFARLLLNTQTIPDGYATRFEDVKMGDWFYNAVAYLDQCGFFFRNKNTTYKPNEPITRAEFVELAYLASNLAESDEIIEFADVPKDHFYYNSIIAAASSGLVNGYEDATFRPDNTITRAEVVTVVNRLLNLVVNDETVLADKLENTFVDIGTHWAKLNILMASNSNVSTKNSYTATLDGVSDEGANLIFKNKRMKLSVNKKNGKVTEIINLENGQDVNSETKNPQFIYLSLSGGAKVSPTSITLEGNRIKVTFKTGDVIYMLAYVHDDFMAFELDSSVPKTYESVTFANLSTNLEMLFTPDSYRLGSMAMTANVLTHMSGMGASNSSYATVLTKYDWGTIGSKHGFALSTNAENAECLQKLSNTIDRSKGLANVTGGPFSRVNADVSGDYAMLYDATYDNMVNVVKYAKEFDIDQIDILFGPQGYRPGDYYFASLETGTAKEFGDTVGKLAEENGIILSLHTYAFYIDYDAVGILANPKWTRQLETMPDVYTLRGNLTKTKESIKTNEDASGFDMTKSFFYRNSRYIMIDDEIILVGAGTPDGFIKCKRAQCGTKPQKHQDGTKIYHLSGYFNRFAPKIGSELFYHIADLTAQTYNDGRFNMLYIDAIDGLSKHDGATAYTTDHYYYFQMFIHRILSQCNNDPIIEFSSSAPQTWNVRGRVGAWDTASRGIKAFINEHRLVNLESERSNMVSTLGWTAFFPDSAPMGGMRNTLHKTIFEDDLDYIGSTAVAYNMSNVYGSFDPKEIDANPEMYANMKYYEFYSRIRKSGYFTEATRQKVMDKIDKGGEFKIIEKSPGEYAFLEMYYAKSNVGNWKDNTAFNGNNPFKTQEPYIRIEGRWSTLSENELLLATFDENNPISGQKLTQSIGLNLLENMVYKFKVKGTGRDGDALLISLLGGVVSGETGGRIDHFIDLNFEGWREMVIVDADNGDYDFHKYVFDGVKTSGMQYSTYRVVPLYNFIDNITIRTCGETAKNAQISSIYAYKQVEAEVKNPTVTVGNSSITFNTTLKGSEYLEFDPATRKAHVHHADQTITEVSSISGSLEIPSGSFNGTYTASATTNAPIRARIVLGFSGEEITN